MSEQLLKCREFVLKEKMISLTDKGEIFNMGNELIGTFRGKLIKIGKPLIFKLDYCPSTKKEVDKYELHEEYLLKINKKG